MKKLPTYLAILMSSVLAGCDKYDVQIPQTLETEEYYVQNIDKARQVKEECEKVTSNIHAIEKSILKNDELKEFRKYLSSKGYNEYWGKFHDNCNNAERGISIAESKEEEAKREAKQQARISEITNYIKSSYAKFEQLSWQDEISRILSEISTFTDDSDPQHFFYLRDENMSSIDKNMITRFGTSEIRDYIEYDGHTLKEDEKNKFALRYSINQLWQKGLAELKAKKYDELVADESYCKKDKRQYSACDVWKQAVSEKRAEIVNNYTTNYDSLKTDYNQCVAKLEDYLKSVNVGKYDKNVPNDILKGIYDTEKNIYAKYPCSEAEEALKKLNLNFDHYENLE